MSVNDTHLSALGNRLDAHDILHAVVVQATVEDDTPFAVGRNLTFRTGVAGVTQEQVLLARLIGREAHRQYIFGERHETFALVTHALVVVSHGSHRTVDIEFAAVVLHLCGVGTCACFYEQFAHRSERTEAEFGFAPCFVGYGRVEVIRREARRLLLVAIEERLTDGVEQMRRLLIDIPVVRSTLGSTRTAAPQRLLVERDALRSNRAQDVGTDRSITDGQGTVFPFAVGVPVAIACSNGLFAVLILVGVGRIPNFLALERSGFVKPNDMLCPCRSYATKGEGSNE